LCAPAPDPNATVELGQAGQRRPVHAIEALRKGRRVQLIDAASQAMI